MTMQHPTKAADRYRAETALRREMEPVALRENLRMHEALGSVIRQDYSLLRADRIKRILRCINRSPGSSINELRIKTGASRESVIDATDYLTVKGFVRKWQRHSNVVEFVPASFVYDDEHRAIVLGARMLEMIPQGETESLPMMSHRLKAEKWRVAEGANMTEDLRVIRGSITDLDTWSIMHRD